MTSARQSRFKRSLVRFKDSGKMKNFLVFLVFVGIAAVFWFIMALNDVVQNSYDVKITIEEVPDSITFINEPPSRLHVTVRDKGASLLHHRISGVPDLYLKFNDFVEGDRFRVSHGALTASLRHIFGSSATITTVSPDSLSLVFTRYPGKRIPVELDYDVTVAPGMVLGGTKMSSRLVDVYSVTKNDTLRRLYTDKIVLRNLDKTTTVDVPLLTKKGIRAIPSSLEVTFVVEQLIKKESDITVEADNIPLGQDILFFPSKVRVAYYVPMSHYNDNTDGIRVEASFNEAVQSRSDKVGVRIVSKAPYMSNMELLQDSVEYTLVRGN